MPGVWVAVSPEASSCQLRSWGRCPHAVIDGAAACQALASCVAPPPGCSPPVRLLGHTTRDRAGLAGLQVTLKSLSRSAPFGC